MSLKPAALPAVLIMTMGLLRLAPSAAEIENQVEDVALAGDRLEFVADVFTSVCAQCHEADGNSDLPRLNLVDDVWNYGGGPSEIERTIREGVPGTLMKPMQDRFSADRIADLARYVALLGQERQTGDVETEAAPARPPVALEGLTSLRIIPPAPALWGARATQRVIVLGRFADGLERDLTASSQLKLSDPAVAGLDADGRLTALQDGQTQLEASVGEHRAHATVQVNDSQSNRPFSFARDIGEILTQHGCNTSDCHGGVKGQGGFKLSLNAIYPRDDYKWIVEGGVYEVLTDEQTESPVPRVDKEQPEQSLLLLKPTQTSPHGGGKVFDRDSRDYQTILQWVRDGAPYGEASDEAAAVITGLQIEPGQTVLEADGRHQLLVTALLSNGRREDITDQVRYKSIDPLVAEVNGAGEVHGMRLGETVVMVRAAGHAASARVGVIAEPISDYPEVQGRNFIDEHVLAKLRKFNIVPSGLSRDEEFLRRVCLDLTGTLPPVDRVREFIADTDPDKRDKLIEMLLASPQYVDYWAYRYADLFRVYFDAQQSPQNTQLCLDWIRNQIALNTPFDQIARVRIAPEGHSGLTMQYYRIQCEVTPQEIVADQFRVFHGVRLECAECHNHPFEAWTQNEFWGLAAFFGQMTRMQNPNVLVDFPVAPGSPQSGKTLTHPRTKQLVRPAVLGGDEIPEQKWGGLRMQLARWMTSPRNTQFAKATVNRIWGAFFGRGLVDPVDDFRSTNPPTHPELLDALAQDFIDHGFDLKHLMRTITQSRTYQLTGDTNASNHEDRVNYSRSLPRRLNAVVLLDAISAATGVDEQFMMDVIGGGPAPPRTRAIDLVPDMYYGHFLDVYGRPTRQTLPQESGDPTVTQALHMLTGPVYTEKIMKEGGRVDRLLKSEATNREAIEELYLAALCRFPTQAERDDLEGLIDNQESREKGLEALTWALISSREFAYTH